MLCRFIRYSKTKDKPKRTMSLLKEKFSAIYAVMLKGGSIDDSK